MNTDTTHNKTHEKNIHDISGIQTRDPNNRVLAGLRLRLSGHRDPLKIDNWSCLLRIRARFIKNGKENHVTIKHTELIILGKHARYFAHIATSSYQLHSAKIFKIPANFILHLD
jgi:hypothetical protein